MNTEGTPPFDGVRHRHHLDAWPLVGAFFVAASDVFFRNEGVAVEPIVPSSQLTKSEPALDAERTFRMLEAMLPGTTPKRVCGGETDRGVTMKERARKARHAAYVLAKERKKNDPRLVELKAKLKKARREANAQAKERRKNDPVQVALKGKLKKDRQEASKLAKDQRKARASATKTAERAAKETRIKGALGFASALTSQPGSPSRTASSPSGANDDRR